MRIVPYTIEFQEDWDNFILKSKNGSIFHTQKFLSYHSSNRWVDKSILIYDDDKLIAVFPACEIEGKIISHPGSSTGGLVVGNQNKFNYTQEIFNKISEYYSKFSSIEFKKHEYIFDNFPSEEVEFSAIKSGFKQTYSELSTCVDLKDFEVSNNRKDKIKRASSKFDIIIDDGNFISFWNILNDILTLKYQVKPVHSLDELIKLKTLLKNELILVSAYENGRIVAGVLLIKANKKVLHSQYIAQELKQKNSHVLSLLFNEIIIYILRNNFHYLNFGISTTKEGEKVNLGLLKFKESFGGNGVARYRYKKMLP